MKFSQFLNEVASLAQEIQSLIEASDTVEWDPSVGREFAGTGVNRDVGTTKRPTASAPVTSGKAKVGDVVVIKDPTGKMTPGLIAGVEQDNAVVVNAKRNMKVMRPLGSLQHAPQALVGQLATAYPNRTVWIYDPKMNVPL